MWLSRKYPSKKNNIVSSYYEILFPSHSLQSTRSIEEGEDEEESDLDAHETGASAEPDNNTGGSPTECKICYGAEINALLLPCKHTTGSTCAERETRMRHLPRKNQECHRWHLHLDEHTSEIIKIY